MSPKSKRGVMTKSLQQIQQENRKFILEAIHGCSYEEALKKELGVGCEVIARIWGNLSRLTIDNLTCFVANCKYFDGDYLRFRELVGDVSVKDLTHEGLERLKEYQDARHRIIEIIGKPLTLSRVLLASIKSAKCMDCFEHKNNKYCSSEWHVDREENLSRIRNFILDNWKNLELETLEEQSEETQTKLTNFLTINK